MSKKNEGSRRKVREKGLDVRMRKGNREMEKNADFDFDARLGRESAKGYSYF